MQPFTARRLLVLAVGLAVLLLAAPAVVLPSLGALAVVLAMEGASHTAESPQRAA